MNFFVTASPAPAPKTKNVRIISLALAGILVGMVVAQLFTFEKFPDVIKEFWLPGGTDIALLLAASIVVLEVAAIPFLLSLYLSPLLRVVSMIAGWLVIALWVVLLVWQNLQPSSIANNGILGATLPLPVGWWSVMLWLAIGLLAAWSAWGMWPFNQNSLKAST